jgi:hypothetical protein
MPHSNPREHAFFVDFQSVSPEYLWRWYLLLPGCERVHRYLVADQKTKTRPQPVIVSLADDHLRNCLCLCEEIFWLISTDTFLYLPPPIRPEFAGYGRELFQALKSSGCGMM